MESLRASLDEQLPAVAESTRKALDSLAAGMPPGDDGRVPVIPELDRIREILGEFGPAMEAARAAQDHAGLLAAQARTRSDILRWQAGTTGRMAAPYALNRSARPKGDGSGPAGPGTAR
jgi:hypothetical protein